MTLKVILYEKEMTTEEQKGKKNALCLLEYIGFPKADRHEKHEKNSHEEAESGL